MTLKEQITKLIETGNGDIYAFLKKLSKEDKKEISPAIKKNCKKYDNRFTEPAKRARISTFVCLNKKEASRLLWDLAEFSLSEEIIDNVLPWYVPVWYSEVINENIPWAVEYETILMLQEKEYLKPSPALVAQSLSHFPKKFNHHFIKKFLEKEITLKEHIWYLFEEPESNFGYYYYEFWEQLFVYFSKNKHIDRERLLIATIDTSNKGLNKNLSGYFFKLLEFLKPNKEEILKLQNHFFSALNSPQSKCINTSLKFIKTVCTDKEFEHQTFIENSTTLLNSEIKSIINSTLMIFDKIAKGNADSHAEVCQMSTEVLLNPDEKLQQRASKLIVKYGNPTELSDTITMYVDGLYQTSKELLSDFLDLTEEVSEEEPFEVQTLSLLEEEIPIYETFDEILFFINQSIEYNNPYDAELALEYLPKLALMVNEKNLSKLEPILKRAYKRIHITGAQFDYLLAYYVYDYGQMLVEQYPTLLKNYTDFQVEKASEYVKLKSLDKIKLRHDIYALYLERLKFSFSFLKKGEAMPFLSVPTHAPCWIEPKAFLEKVFHWEEKEIHYYDWQIALARIPLEVDTSGLEPLIKKVKNKELQQVLLYQFGFKTLDKKNIKEPHWWIQSILNRQIPDDLEVLKTSMKTDLHRELGTQDWRHTVQDKKVKVYKASKMVDKIEQHKILKVDIFTNLKTNLKSKHHKKNIYDQIYYLSANEYGGTPIREKDDQRLLMLTPNTPTAFLTSAIHCTFGTSDLGYNDTKRVVANLQQALHEIWQKKDYPEHVYLFLATCMLCDDKTARAFTAETWIKANSESNMDNAVLGSVLGRLENEEYSGLKRLTDLIISNMLHISKHHDTALLELIDHMIPAMHSNPIKGTKKLLELHSELRQGSTSYKINDKTKEMLEQWQETKSLKSLIKKILAE